MSIQLQKVHRFEVLDALRGVAALLVVQIHMPFLFAATMPFPHAYLAVDFFFMLSGFVMAFAYGSRLRQGWPTLLFLRDRFIRLYPLFLLSIPFGLLHLFVVSHKEHSPLPNSEIPWLLLFTILLLPLPKFFQAGGVYSHPVVGPSWSLPSLRIGAGVCRYSHGCPDVAIACFTSRKQHCRSLGGLPALPCDDYPGFQCIRIAPCGANVQRAGNDLLCDLYSAPVGFHCLHGRLDFAIGRQSGRSRTDLGHRLRVDPCADLLCRRQVLRSAHQESLEGSFTSSPNASFHAKP
jgi:hypothetical protein